MKKDFCSNKLIYIILGLIILFSSIIRVYKIDVVPPSLTWDETAVGYNAYTIGIYGVDEYGKFLPLYFRSFGEDKQPIHIYITAIFVKLFGLSEFSIRIPAAIFGSLNVLLIFLLSKILFKNDLIGLLSSLFLAISPQNIFFSRFNHEANFALFFFMLGLLIFYTAIKGKYKILPLSFLFFFLSTISYHAAEIVIPVIVLLLCILYWKEICREKRNIIIVAFLLVMFTMIGIYNPKLFGVTRYNQTVQGNNEIEKTEMFKRTHNYFLGKINLTLEQYLWHFNPRYLFISGDRNPRLSSQGSGEFYLIDAVFLVVGLIYLLYRRSKEGMLIFSWAIIGPLPSSLFGEAPHAGRAAFMMGSWQIVSALGFYALIGLFKKVFLKWITGSIFIIILFMSLAVFLQYYFSEFPKRYAIDWQYGMKQVVEYARDHTEYNEVYTTAVRAQPYIFFLYYLKMPVQDYLNTIVYSSPRDQGFNNVSSFERYSFGGWNPTDSLANRGVLYVLSPSEYDGLRYRSNFDVKKVVHYPNGTDAFFLVTLR